MAIVRRGPQLKKYEKTKASKSPTIHGKNPKPLFVKKSRYKGKNNKFETAPIITAATLPKNTKVKILKPAKPVFVKTPKLASTLAPGLERLERAIAHLGLASRREAKALITGGKVKVNNKVIREPGFGIRIATDVIDVDGQALAGKESVLVYKPRDIETNKTLEKNKDLHDYFPKLKHLAPIGRLDKDSEGLIIMSNDGSLARALTREDSQIAKTYEVTVRENVTDDALRKMSTGIVLDKIKTKPAQTKRLSRKSFSIVLHEGRKHQIRRMCDACHLNVESLLRTNIGHLSIGSMKPGAMRRMIEEDVERLKK